MKLFLIFLPAFLGCVQIAAQTQQYTLNAVDKSHVDIVATVHIKNNTIVMPLRGSSNALPNGTADLVKTLMISDNKGNKIDYETAGKGRWKLSRYASPLLITYTVSLEHQKYNWDNYGGIDAVSYVNNDGIYGTGYSFFIVPDSMDAPCDIQFQIPARWRASTPWLQTGAFIFKTTNTDDLLNNCFFIGTHLQKTLKVGSFEVLIAVGGNLKSKATLFEKVLAASIDQYWKIFKRAQIKKYLVVLNEGNMTDGDAFNNSFDQLIKGEVNKDGIISWGNILAHETFHLWNGISMYSDEQNEWFKEGFTEYMSVKTLRKAGLINDALLFKKLESFHSRYWLASNITSRDITLKNAGDNKSSNVFLVYGGGSLMAFILDVEIRKATANKKGIEDFLYEMYQLFGTAGKSFSLSDIKSTLQKVSGKPLGKLIELYVEEGKTINTNEYLEDCGLGITSFAEEHYLYRLPLVKPNQLYQIMFQ